MSRGLEYVVDPYAPVRRRTREVRVGDVGIGGDNPIRVQSMTTTDTRDTEATVAQTLQLAEAGCEIVRVTAPSITEAENLANIRIGLRERGCNVPLVADIHFTPNAALVAAEHVEKVRVNPGNYADKKRFEVREYSDAEYADELARVAERFLPLVRKCRERGVAMRIGTNHGSLSDRIMNRYGDTPRGMVESALEFLDVCEAEDYLDVVFSMKASNAQVAIQAYRLLAARLRQRSGDAPSYPFHVGVTEAGDGDDGRIKSAIGIGALLEDGIGDTVRVSLTEHPVKEVPVAQALARDALARWGASPSPSLGLPEPFSPDPYAHARRATKEVGEGTARLGGEAPVRVELELAGALGDPSATAAQLATAFATLGERSCESLIACAATSAELAALPELVAALAELGALLPVALRIADPELLSGPLGAAARIVFEVREPGACFPAAAAAATHGLPLEWSLAAGLQQLPALVDAALAAGRDAGLADQRFSATTEHPLHGARAIVARLAERGAAQLPVVLRHQRDPAQRDDLALIRAAIELGAPLCDGIGDAIVLAGEADPARAVDLAYRILQGARLRTTRTEYISCPSCGRTLFDLEETTARVKAKTEHLKGVKIAIMGCVVNGPGEMADADFGYVGCGPGRVNLYVGSDVVVRNVPQDEAPDRLLQVIDERWDGDGASSS
ncbi:MAG: (E)-4-hydroxy-3-methylbut-2-enyl-diphosphate synthase [Myxococcota bacterium]|nr:(E)-4-hydroxy-3-methylbut-2-enyl-diphosphate synthase [Myxococcota bacterium]